MWVSGGGLGRDRLLAGGNTGGIILSSLLLLLPIHWEHLGHDLTKLAVLCVYDKMGRQEAKVVMVPCLPGCELLGSLPQGLLLPPPIHGSVAFVPSVDITT